MKAIMLVLMLALSISATQAQQYTKSYFTGGWQYNVPLSTGFTDKASGYGFYLEGGYNINPYLSVGLFLNYQTNYEYVPRQTYPVSSTGEVTTDQQHGIRQLPFGASLRYRFLTGMWQPYVSAKVGANHMYAYSDFYTLRAYDDTWGLHLSPEIGISIYPFPTKRIGFNVAAYYGYSTNKSNVLFYDMNGINNTGFRLGFIF